MLADIPLAGRVKKINPSPTLAITAKAKKMKSLGLDVIGLAAGEPDFDTPDFIKKAAIDAIEKGFTKYTPTTGTADLKKLICEKFKKDNSLDYASDQIAVSCGAKHSIFNTLMALVGNGDEVLIPLPYWVSYPEMVRISDAKPVFIKTGAANNFKFTSQDLKNSITPKSKVLILNSPSNPTGCVYTQEELAEIAKICVNNNIFVISDEIYEKIIFGRSKHISIASLNSDIYSRTITVNGMSKSYSMTGWRIGYLGGPKEIVNSISKLQDHSTSNPASISQKAAEAALAHGEEFIDFMRGEFEKRRDYACERLEKIKNITYTKPEGAFYIFCDISRTRMDASTFAGRLLEEALIAIIPGEGFGSPNHIRISFAASIEHLKKSFDRIEGWMNKL
ncbi:MAG: pyridoxal phosphate-dependent aminotransferase [Candidatus Omnitrophota bacterium]